MCSVGYSWDMLSRKPPRFLPLASSLQITEPSAPSRRGQTMAKLKRISIAEAKQQAADWEIEWFRSCRSAAVDSHFQDASPAEVVAMWQSQTNAKGRPLNQFEFEALVTRFFVLFGAYPAGDEELNGSAADPATPQEPEPADDTMLSVKEVARRTGISVSTINRMVRDGRFPKPMRLSQRRVGWVAREVKDWVRQLDDQRRAPRQ
jgi:prophage regulatory protein